jgi:hypothetical protein
MSKKSKLPALPQSRPPTREDLFQLIDAEIEHADAEERRRGFNMWFALVAFAACAWLLLNFGDYARVRWVRAFALMTALVMAADLIQLVRRYTFLRLHKLPSGGARFSLVSHVLACSPACELLTLIRNVAFLFFLVVYGTLPFLPARVWLLGAAINALGAWAWVTRRYVFAKHDVPVPVNTTAHNVQNGIRGYVYGFAIAFPSAQALYIVLAIIWSKSLGHPWLVDAKLAALGGSALILAHILTHVSDRNPMIDTLRQLRRDLSLNTRPFEEVRSDVEIVTIGMSTSYILQTNVKPLLAAIIKARTYHRSMLSDMEKLDRSHLEFIARSASVSPASAHEVVSSTQDLICAATSYMDHNRALQRFVEEELKPAAKQWNRALTAVKTAGEEEKAQPLIDRIQAELNEIKRIKEVGAEKNKAILARIESAKNARALDS